MQWDWSSILGYLDAWRTRAERAHASVSDDGDLDAELADATPDAQGPALRHRRAWCGLSSLANPARDVAFAKSIGLTGLDIIANDHSAAREPRRFDIRPTQQIVTLATMARDAGLDVHLMSWIMPHRSYLIEAAEQLPDLVEKTGALSVCFDAEEPWTLAKKRLNYLEAGQLVDALFRDRNFELGVTGIRYAATHKLAPLIAVCDYVVPQAYSTSTSKASPSTVVSKGVATWRKKFGNGPRMVAGLAAYRQSGIKGHTTRSAMQAAIDDAEQHTDEVVYWSLNSLRKSPAAAAVVRSMSQT